MEYKGQEIRPQAEGFLEKVLIDEGQYVTAGQPLFKINSQTYNGQLNNASASHQAAEAAITNAQLEIDKTDAFGAKQSRVRLPV